MTNKPIEEEKKEDFEETRIIKKGIFGSTGNPTKDIIYAILDLTVIILLLIAFTYTTFFQPKYNLIINTDCNGYITSTTPPTNANLTELQNDLKKYYEENPIKTQGDTK